MISIFKFKQGSEFGGKVFSSLPPPSPHIHTCANTLTTNNSNKISETDIHGAISGFLLHCIMKKKAGCCDKTMNGGNCLFSKKNSSQCQMLILKWMLIIVLWRDMSHFFLYRPGGWGIHFVFIEIWLSNSGLNVCNFLQNYKCDYCTVSCQSRSKLIRHVKNSHPTPAKKSRVSNYICA